MTSTKLNVDDCREYIRKNLFKPKEKLNASAIKEKPDFVGIELEAFPYVKDTQKSEVKFPVPLYVGNESLINILIKASKPFGGVATFRNPSESYNSDNSVADKIIFPTGDHFLFEPGGQVEIRTSPCDSAAELDSHLQSMQEILKQITKSKKIHFGQTGFNPMDEILNIGNQIDKTRYRAMEKYLDSISPFGRKMMLQTCSMHVNIEIGSDENTRVKRITAANLLVPFVTALFSNSPHKGSDSKIFKAYRSYLWQNLDHSRTGILPINKVLNTLREEDLVELYLAFALNAPLIYIQNLGDKVLPKNYTLNCWLENPIEGVFPDIWDFENHLSLLFPEVRIRGYLELRSVDAPPIEWQMVPVCFYSGLLCNDYCLDKTLELLIPLASETDLLYKKAVFGFDSEEIFNISKKLMKLSIEGFSGLPEHFKNNIHLNQMITFFENFTSNRKSFADS